MTPRNPKKKSEKRELAKDKWYNQMGQVGTSWNRGTSGTRRRASSDLSGTSGTRRRGSSDLGGTSGTRSILVGQVGQGQRVCPLEPFHSVFHRLGGSRRHLCPKPPQTFDYKVHLFWLKEPLIKI